MAMIDYKTVGIPTTSSFGSAEPTQDPKEQTAIASADYAMEQARDLSHRVQKLAERMLGPIPQSQATQGVSLTKDALGIFPLLQSSSDRTMSAMSEGFDAVNRIERSLP